MGLGVRVALHPILILIRSGRVVVILRAIGVKG
jgi:hypothetical protein